MACRRPTPRARCMSKVSNKTPVSTMRGCAHRVSSQAGLMCTSSSIAVRVERLLEWRGPGHRLQRAFSWSSAVFVTAVVTVLVTMTVAIATHYGATLVLTHRLTELLVP